MSKQLRCSKCQWPLKENEVEYDVNGFKPLCHGCSIQEMEREFWEREGPQP